MNAFDLGPNFGFLSSLLLVGIGMERLEILHRILTAKPQGLLMVELRDLQVDRLIR